MTSHRFGEIFRFTLAFGTGPGSFHFDFETESPGTSPMVCEGGIVLDRKKG